MSCKERFEQLQSLDWFCATPNPLINDQMMSIAVQEKQQTTPETNFDILLNKHLNNHEITDIQLQQLPEHQRNALVQIQSKSKQRKKRPDQCQKLFYKRAFKYSQHKFFKRTKNKSRKMSHFYHFHFDSISLKQNLPITAFYHPNKKTKPGLNLGYKTFNTKYVKLLLKSKTFKDDIKQYHKIFFNQCLNERAKKVLTFTNSIRRLMNRCNEDSRILMKHFQSAQCKIPWTCHQIRQTWELAQRDLEQDLECEQDNQNKENRDIMISLGCNSNQQM